MYAYEYECIFIGVLSVYAYVGLRTTFGRKSTNSTRFLAAFKVAASTVCVIYHHIVPSLLERPLCQSRGYMAIQRSEAEMLSHVYAAKSRAYRFRFEI